MNKIVGTVAGVIIIFLVFLIALTLYETQTRPVHATLSKYMQDANTPQAEKTKENTEITNGESGKIPELFVVKRCGIPSAFQNEKWFGWFVDKIENEYRMSEYKAVQVYNNSVQFKRNRTLTDEQIRKNSGTFSKEEIRHTCLVQNKKTKEAFALALVGNEYCSLGALFRVDIQRRAVKRVFYPEGEGCSESLAAFKATVKDGYMLPVISAFGDAGVYSESFYYYDLLHNALFKPGK